MKWSLAVALVLMAAGAASGASAPHPLMGFHTPGWAAQCVVTQLGAQNNTRLTCWTPNDGFTVRMTGFRTIAKEYLNKNRGYRDKYWPGLLSFGERWYDCHSYAAALVKSKPRMPEQGRTHRRAVDTAR